MPNKTIYYTFFLLLIFSAGILKAQNIQIKGKVMDKEFTLLPYAHAYTSAQQGTYADIDANFYLKVSLGDTINISSIGYEESKLVVTDSADRQSVTVMLKKKTIVLDDIVVRDYYQANTIIKKPELEKMKVPGVNYAPASSEADQYHLGVVGAAFSPATALYRVTSKKYKEEKRNYEETVVRQKEAVDFAKAKKNLKEALDAIGEELDEYYYRDFMTYVGLSLKSIASRNTYDLILIIREPLVRYKKELYDDE